jgi:hypothetical protein
VKSLLFLLLTHLPALADPRFDALYQKAYMVYCAEGHRALDRPRALDVAREAGRGEYRIEDFLSFWVPTCSFDESRELARDAMKGGMSSKLFTEALGRKCKEGHALRAEDSYVFARAGAKGELLAEDFYRAWDDSCRFLDSIRSARHAKLLKQKKGKFKATEPAPADPEPPVVPEVR